MIDGSLKAVGPSAYGLELYRFEDSNFNREKRAHGSLGNKEVGRED